MTTDADTLADLHQGGTVPPGFAHDLGNLLTAIHGYATLLAEDLPDGAQRDFARRIVTATEEARALAATLPRARRRRGLRVLLVEGRPVDAAPLEAAGHEVARAATAADAASAVAAAAKAWDAVLVAGDPPGLRTLEARCRMAGLPLARIPGDADAAGLLAALTGATA